MKNEHDLKKVIDMIRTIAIVILIIHFYFNCYAASHSWGLTSHLSDQLLVNINRTGFLPTFHKSKIIAIGLLLLSLLGVRGRKNEKLTYRTALTYLVIGLILYFESAVFLLINSP